MGYDSSSQSSNANLLQKQTSKALDEEEKKQDTKTIKRRGTVVQENRNTQQRFNENPRVPSYMVPATEEEADRQYKIACLQSLNDVQYVEDVRKIPTLNSLVFNEDNDFLMSPPYQSPMQSPGLSRINSTN